MKTQDLIPGREYVVDHALAKYPARPARLIACGKGVHTFSVPVDPNAQITELREFKVRSRDIEREWTPEDALRVQHHETAKDMEERLNAKLALMFPEEEETSLGYKRQAKPAEVRIYSTGDEAAPLRVNLFFKSTPASERVLKALGIELTTQVGEGARRELESG